MRKNKMSTGVKIILIVGIVLMLAGAGWWAYSTFADNATPVDPVEDIPKPTETIPPEMLVSKVYREFYLPDDKNETLPDKYLDLVLVEAGRLSDNSALEDALSTVGVTNDGYYFLAELTYDSADAFKGIIPFGYLNGNKNGETQVAMVQLYVMNSDLTGVASLSHSAITPGCHYVLVGYADFDEMDDAQVHLYNSDYDVAVIHMEVDSETIVPYGYTKANDSVVTPETQPAVTTPETTEGTVAPENTGATEGEE